MPGAGGGESEFNGDGVPMWENDNFLEVDGGDGGPTTM